MKFNEIRTQVKGWFPAAMLCCVAALVGCNGEDNTTDSSSDAESGLQADPPSSASGSTTTKQVPSEPLTVKVVRERMLAMESSPPTENDPVVAMGRIFRDPSSDSKAMAAVRIDVASSWHLYGSVPTGLPFEKTTLELNLPDGVTAEGDWDTPSIQPKPTDPQLGLWMGRLVFVQSISMQANTELDGLQAKLSYQVCTEQLCLPPTTVEIELETLP